jgi:hypothetical protein
MAENEIVLSDLFQQGIEDSEQRLKAIEKFYDVEGINLKTDLNNHHIEALVQIDFIQKLAKDEWKCDLGLNDVTDLFKELRVSHERKGRKEGVEMLRTFVIDALGESKKGLSNLLGIPQ